MIPYTTYLDVRVNGHNGGECEYSPRVSITQGIGIGSTLVCNMPMVVLVVARLETRVMVSMTAVFLLVYN